MTPSPRLRAVVAVPARNEAESLPRLLASLAAQHGLGPEAVLGVVVVANGCSDDTADAARRVVEDYPTLLLRVIERDFPPEDAHVGTARRLALDEGASWLEAEDLPDGVLLSTDADARVPADWLQANLHALSGAEIAGGALVIDGRGSIDPTVARLHANIARYWEAVRAIEEELDPPRHDPAPRHGDHTGASLALRAGLYRAVGGLPPLPGGEDNALVQRVVEAGGRLRHDPAVRVFVSDRIVGRATGGMAQDMARREAVARGEQHYLLPHPARWRTLIATRAQLRAAWRRGPDVATSALGALGLTEDEIAAVDVSGCVNDIAFVERASRRLRLGDAFPPDLPVEEALPLFDARDAVRSPA